MQRRTGCRNVVGVASAADGRKYEVGCSMHLDWEVWISPASRCDIEITMNCRCGRVPYLWRFQQKLQFLNTKYNPDPNTISPRKGPPRFLTEGRRSTTKPGLACVYYV